MTEIPSPTVLRALKALMDDDLATIMCLFEFEIRATSRFHKYSIFPEHLQDGPPLISVAAYYRSRKCFDFLFSTLPIDGVYKVVDGKSNSIMYFALLGGDRYIISSLMIYSIPNSDDLVACVVSRNMQLLTLVMNACSLTDIHTARVAAMNAGYEEFFEWHKPSRSVYTDSPLTPELIRVFKRWPVLVNERFLSHQEAPDLVTLITEVPQVLKTRSTWHYLTPHVTKLLKASETATFYEQYIANCQYVDTEFLASHVGWRSPEGDTALMVATTNSQHHFLEPLVAIDDIEAFNDSGDTALTIAIKYSNTTIISKLLEFGADPNHIVYEAPLSLAKSLPIFKMLIQAGALPNVGINILPLHTALKQCYSYDIKSLLDLGMDPTLPDSAGVMPICKVDDIYLAEEMIAKGASVLDLTTGVIETDPTRRFPLTECGANYYTAHGKTFLGTAIIKNCVNMVKKLVTDAQADPNQHTLANGIFSRPLAIAASFKETSLEIIDFLAATVDPNLPDRRNHTPMDYAVINKCPASFVDCLVSHGAHVSVNAYNSVISSKNYPQMKAFMQSDDPVPSDIWARIDAPMFSKHYQDFLDRGADPTHPDAMRHAALYGIGVVQKFLGLGANPNDGIIYASTVPIAQLLIDKGADFNRAAEAILKGHPPVVLFMLKQGADPNKQYNNTTPLEAILIAKSLPLKKSIELLLEKGADPSIGKPLVYAMRLQLYEESLKFIELGADVNVTDEKGMHPLDYLNDIVFQSQLFYTLTAKHAVFTDPYAFIRRILTSGSTKKFNILPYEQYPTEILVEAVTASISPHSILKRVMKHGADLNVETPRGCLLSFANPKWTKRLISAGASLLGKHIFRNKQISWEALIQAGYPLPDLFVEACKLNDTIRMTELVNLGVDPNEPDRDGNFPIQFGQLNLVVRAGANILLFPEQCLSISYELLVSLVPNIDDVLTVIAKTTRNRKRNIIKELRRMGARFTEWCTQLCKDGDYKNVKKMIEDGVPIKASCLKYGSVAGVLLEAGANARAICGKGTTPLQIVAKANHDHFCMLLQQDYETPDETGLTPLQIAMKYKSTEALITVIQSDIDINVPVFDGLNPFAYSIINCWDAGVDLLAVAKQWPVESFSDLLVNLDISPYTMGILAGHGYLAE